MVVSVELPDPIAKQLHLRGDVVAVFAALRVKMDAQNVDRMSRRFPFREQPDAFHHIVASFGEGVRNEKSQLAA